MAQKVNVFYCGNFPLYSNLNMILLVASYVGMYQIIIYVILIIHMKLSKALSVREFSGKP